MEFFDAELIVKRLQEPQFGFEVVGNAADYASIKSLSGMRVGSAYVVLVGERNPAGEQNQPRMKASAVVTLGIIVTARNYRDQGGAEAVTDLKPMVGSLRKALIGWPPAGASPLQWQRGDVMEYDEGRILWCDVFSTAHILGA